MRLCVMLTAITAAIALQAGASATGSGGDDLGRLTGGRHGSALDLTSHGRSASIPIGDLLDARPVTFSCWVRLDHYDAFNIILASGPKSGRHWEVYSAVGTGQLSVYIPQVGDARSDRVPPLRTWFFLAFRIEERGFQLYVNGERILEKRYDQRLLFDAPAVHIASIPNEALHMTGAIDELVISQGDHDLTGWVPEAPATSEGNVAVFRFDSVDDDSGVTPNDVGASIVGDATILDSLAMPQGDRFLDEVLDDAYAEAVLHGDRWVEAESRLPIMKAEAVAVTSGVAANAPVTISLDGAWRMKGGAPFKRADLAKENRLTAVERQGVTEKWFEYGADRSDWYEVNVPTTVQNALLELGETPDPLWDTNTWDELQEHGWPQDFPWHHRKTRIEQQDWWFARTFDVPESLKGQTVRLYFDGVDYGASFYLNGHSLGYHQGLFGGPLYNVTSLLHYDKPNELVVAVDTVPDAWTGVPKGSPGWGWHYGHLISLGIWRSVLLESVPAVEIQSPFVKTQSITEDGATLAVEYYTNSQVPGAVEATVCFEIAGENFEGAPVAFANTISVPYGKTRWETTINLPGAKVWWPVNYGDQPLYTLRAALNAADGAADVKSTRFGIRTIEMKPVRGTRAEIDYRWQFVINGVPMFIKGANWCWTDPMLQQDPAKYEHILEMAKRGGIQMFRCWGGGMVESDIFYRLCDEKGLMVYEEFPYCWGPPDFPLTDPAVLDQQVSDVVKRNRNHPSLVMWGGGNENVGITGNDDGLLLVGRRCRQYDPTRPFHRTSPWGGSLHNWGVFHHGNPIDSGFVNSPAPWFGEFGLPTMSNWLESLEYLPEAKMNTWPPAQDDGGIMAHMNQFGFGDMAKVMRYADYGPIQSWRQYIEYGQMAQGDEIAFATNLQRAGSYLNKGGLWFYKMTELFPGQSWGVVGFYGHPKLSYYRAKQFFAPRAAFAQYDRYDLAPGEAFKAGLYAANDSAFPLGNATASAVIYGSDLQELWRKDYPVENVPTATRVELDQLELTLDPEKIKPFLMAVSLRGADGERLSDQWYWFNFRAKTDAVKKLEEIPAWGWPHDRAPEAFEAYGSLPEARLLTLPKAGLQVRVERDGDTGVFVITNTANLPAFNVIIDDFPYAYGTYLEDNSFSLYPGESRRIAFELTHADQDLSGVTVKAWNADPVQPAL